MIKLFAVMEAAGLRVDSSNDNLSDTDEGMLWEVPLEQPLPEKFPHQRLVEVAVRILGDVFRGYAYYPEGSYSMPCPAVMLSLSRDYTDEQHTPEDK